MFSQLSTFCVDLFELVLAGILKGFLGLSASICATIYIGVFKPHELSFLLFLALFPAALGLLALPLLNVVPFEEQSQSPDVHHGFTPGTWAEYAPVQEQCCQLLASPGCI